MFDHKINESAVCGKCGAFYQDSWKAPEGAKHKPEAMSYLDAAKMGILKQKYAALKAKGTASDDLVELLGVLHPELREEQPTKKSPYQAFQEAHQAFMAAQKRNEKAFDKAADLSLRLEDAQAEATEALVAAQKAEAALAEARKAYAAHSGLAAAATAPAARQEAVPPKWWDIAPPDAQALEGEAAEAFKQLQGPLLDFQRIMREQQAARDEASAAREAKRKRPGDEAQDQKDDEGDHVMDHEHQQGPPVAAPAAAAQVAPVGGGPPAPADGGAEQGAASSSASSGGPTKDERLRIAREAQIAKAKSAASAVKQGKDAKCL